MPNSDEPTRLLMKPHEAPSNSDRPKVDSYYSCDNGTSSTVAVLQTALTHEEPPRGGFVASCSSSDLGAGRYA